MVLFFDSNQLQQNVDLFFAGIFPDTRSKYLDRSLFYNGHSIPTHYLKMENALVSYWRKLFYLLNTKQYFSLAANQLPMSNISGDNNNG